MTATAKIINFARGHPNRSLLPLREIQQILGKLALESNEKSLLDSLNYPKEDPGDSQLLEELRLFLDRHSTRDDLGLSNKESSIGSTGNLKTSFFMTHGVSHGLEMLCSIQTSPGDVVLMERPTYFLAAGIFKARGLNVQSLPMTNNGIDIDALDRSMANGDRCIPRMIYIIPTHQNPSAYTMRIEDRRKLASLAKKYNFMVVADEVYHFLDWRNPEVDDRRPGRMAIVDKALTGSVTDNETGCCVSISSFTKIFAPGIRCGWIEGPEHVVESLTNLGYIQSQGGCTPFVGQLMKTCLREGLGDKVLDNLNAAYRVRSQRLCQSLAADDGIEIFCIPLGGYFVWVSFQGVEDTSDLLDFCIERGVRFLPGERCDVAAQGDGDYISPCKKFARLCFADLDLEDIDAGTSKLLTCYREYLKGM